MRARTALALFFLSLAAGSALAQDGLRVPQRPGPGIDPALAPGWLSPTYERFALAPRLRYHYAFTEHGSLGMSYSAGRDYDPGMGYGLDRQYGLVGQYSLTPNWSLSAKALGREPGNVLRFNDLRIGIRRAF
jgi:hypothetical protein